MSLNQICVYCGSNNGRQPEYIEQARAFGRELVKRDIGLVYGGAAVGLMGAVADAVIEAGGRAIGIIPERLMQKELAHRGLTELHVVQTMHERKSMMAEKADGFVALPGGAGTLEELFEAWTWAQLGMHQKPCGLLNIAGYYDALATFLDHVADEAFMQPQHRAMLSIEADPALLLDRFANYVAPTVPKWIK
ncbi:LOG family protein [Bordetella avium]|uniref:Cytokinin riboside 5'-monophosphate phosphoribohydrolase n=1 Tax=Bordetella avium (strain 197N) TaxID=360910 RepID=Q2L0J6_BORA1|nr:TIGR00730 family Rossman fold protein [Bordetella avium]AZY47878.1 TIGR00730 family Rossman fold protein [Bordetella avium]AZY51250.1 TIGR00730 family Rossman fold protein [Bordetella avium]RIQ14895.1 TIGR00730 family Rossman fold protein [Bordetella avium]RIQ18614.1 TIGR00730 family Rossman fold protein [Bordetella avium]RIQ35350.1 TIGR00730 family Rossman fold protein [Bordetella avium]